MRILEIVDFFKPFWSSGGITPVAYHISKGLVAMGHEVTVYTNGDGRTPEYYVEKNRPTLLDGMTVYYFRNLCPLLAKRNIYSTYMLPIVARRHVAAFDIIHIHTYRSALAVLAWHYAQKHDVPYVLQPHGTVDTFFEKGTLKRIFDGLWGHRMLKGAAKLIAVTPAETSQYRNVGVAEDRVEIVPNGIDLSEFAILPKKGEFRRKHGLGESEKVILFLGRIHMIKGLDLLLRAFADLRVDNTVPRLVISGPDDGYLSELLDLVRQLKLENRVLLPGPCYGEDRLKAYVDADVYVLPSVYEVFGITLLEAWACGIPVVTTDRCGLAEWVHKRGGYVVPYDANALRHALGLLLASESLRKQFGEAGRRLVEEEFTWSGTVERMEDIYREALLSKPNATSAAGQIHDRYL
jgi:glycosyltransferase involved in cell wall biosynthesis